MTQDEARAILLRAFVATNELPAELAELLAIVATPPVPPIADAAAIEEDRP